MALFTKKVFFVTNISVYCSLIPCLKKNDYLFSQTTLTLMMPSQRANLIATFGVNATYIAHTVDFSVNVDSRIRYAIDKE